MDQGSTKPINSAETMIRTIRDYGIIPFFKCPIPGWSVEELTDPDFWFYSSEQLGPWDWKIDAVREGDIAYGKFLGGKAAFATLDYYRHLMNWRRSLPRFRMAIGEDFHARTKGDRQLQALSPIALEAIRNAGSLQSGELRKACSLSFNSPAITKSIMDGILQFLDMGTWTVTGDFTRVYRGANLEYSGWQRSSFTTPDALFGVPDKVSEGPFWARMIEEEAHDGLIPECSPQESREFIAGHIAERFPVFRSQAEKLVI